MTAPLSSRVRPYVETVSVDHDTDATHCPEYKEKTNG